MYYESCGVIVLRRESVFLYLLYSQSGSRSCSTHFAGSTILLTAYSEISDANCIALIESNKFWYLDKKPVNEALDWRSLRCPV